MLTSTRGNVVTCQEKDPSRLLAEAFTDLILPLAQSVYLILGRGVVLHSRLVEAESIANQLI
jgi:hypothetical protein